MSKTKISSFIASFVALVTGDDTTVQAEKTWRQAKSAFESAIPAAVGDTIDFEDKIAEAKEILQRVRVNNGQPITNRAAYIERILSARVALEEAEENLKLHREKIDVMKEELELLSKTEEVVEK